MTAHLPTTIAEEFQAVDDPRIKGRTQYSLLSILTISLCALVSGADDVTGIAEFGRAREPWLAEVVDLPSGIPSHDTIGRVLGMLDPTQLEQCFVAWMRQISQLTDGEVVALDGKALRGSHDRANGEEFIHMVSAWATENRMVLGQVQTDAKSNEITAIPCLLDMLELRGCLVTIDAMGCQTAIAQQIREQGADYLLALKGNQGQLHADVELLFADLEASGYRAYAYDYHKTINKGHGRIETRECWTITDPTLIAPLRRSEAFVDLHTLVRIRATRRIGSQLTTEDRYYIGSATPTAPLALAAVRHHWHIENRLHWVLDVAFREDYARLRQQHAAHNLALLRQLALNALQQETSRSLGVKNKRLRAAWDLSYLRKVLAHLGI